MLVAPGQKVRYNRWREYIQPLSHRQPETRYIREIIFGKARALRYYEISKTDSPTTQPLETWFIMTNLPKSWQLQLGKRYSLRGWIEYGFKQVKNELGWADFRVTDYISIERWWEVVLSAYLLISWHANDFKNQLKHNNTKFRSNQLLRVCLNIIRVGNQVRLGRVL